MPKNIVICCDGTGNQIGDAHSNVIKLYRVLRKTQKQIVYYDPGVGTLESHDDWGVISQNIKVYAGLGFGYGLDNNVIGAYKFLIENYVDGDDIYLFGFSRGAYSVRVLAGFINSIGLLTKHQLNLCDFAYTAYKKISNESSFENVRLFEKVLRPNRIPIRFLGIWDTVSTVIVPRKDRLYIPKLSQLAYTQKNPSIKQVRHALSIDERRSMFRPYLWQENQEYWGSPFEPSNPEPQDVVQMWFSGVHSDIGGGYAESESGLSKLTLHWMLEEIPETLLVNKRSANEIVEGKPVKGREKSYAPPDPAAKQHDELESTFWKLQEFFPKKVSRREWNDRKSLFGLYIPRAEPRFIPSGALIHPSVHERIAKVKGYDPENLP
ncbi:MAG: DUF2235 domain-containing protein [Aliiglaciecola sp.]